MGRVPLVGNRDVGRDKQEEIFKFQLMMEQLHFYFLLLFIVIFFVSATGAGGA